MDLNAEYGFIQFRDDMYLVAGACQIDYLCKGVSRELFFEAVKDICAEAEKSDSPRSICASRISKVNEQLKHEQENNLPLYDSVSAWWEICYGTLTQYEHNPAGKYILMQRLLVVRAMLLIIFKKIADISAVRGCPDLNEDDARLALELPCTIRSQSTNLTKALLKGLYRNRAGWYFYHLIPWGSSVRAVWNSVNSVYQTYIDIMQEIVNGRTEIENKAPSLPGYYKSNNEEWQKYIIQHFTPMQEALEEAIRYLDTSGAAEDVDVDVDNISSYLSWKHHLAIAERAWSVFWDLIEADVIADSMIMRHIIGCLEVVRSKQYQITGGCNSQGQCEARSLRRTSRRAWALLHAGPDWIDREFWWQWEERESAGQAWLQALRAVSEDNSGNNKSEV